MSKLTEFKPDEHEDTVTHRAVMLVTAVVDDLDALAASIVDPDAQAKVYGLADEYEKATPKIIGDFIAGSPGLPPVEPPKPIVVVAPTVSREAADATALATIAAYHRKRAPRVEPPKPAPGAGPLFPASPKKVGE